MKEEHKHVTCGTLILSTIFVVALLIIGVPVIWTLIPLIPFACVCYICYIIFKKLTKENENK